MIIVAVVVTCNRIELLPRALTSIAAQSRKPNFVYVVSNSGNEILEEESTLCKRFGYTYVRNNRTVNYAGALNTAIEEIIKNHGLKEDLYFASLDDDDEWLAEYLYEVEQFDEGNFDLIASNYLRISQDENLLMKLPEKLTFKDFLTGNVGIGGSNTFIRLHTLLYAGCFDESLPATVDRDIMIRVFQQNPTYKVIHKHLVTAHTDNNRERVTTNREKKKLSFQIFYYKYKHLMNETEKDQFFERAQNFFSVQRDGIESTKTDSVPLYKVDLQFSQKGDYQFIIGFIAGNELIAERIATEIVFKNISVDLVLIIDDTQKGTSLANCKKIFNASDIQCNIITHHLWKKNLASGHYGSYFKHFSEINSIPLGRTILHHHLFIETTEFKKPVFWIIDDDIAFSAITNFEDQKVDLFELINNHIESADAIIGSISSDPPVPSLCSIRTQLIDLFYSSQNNKAEHPDLFNIRMKPDYYYDLSDLHTDHLEVPLFHKVNDENVLQKIFSGKSLSRPALQRKLKSEERTISKRGANTLVLNREMLQYYPVINLEVNNKFARRGDLLWALFNQVVSGRRIIEHTFSLDHNRPINDFDLQKELDKAAYDIIGYAFNKAILKVIEKIKIETEPNRPKDIFDKLVQTYFHNYFLESYIYFLERRKAKFYMNYLRIVGLTKLLNTEYPSSRNYYNEMSDLTQLSAFNNTLNDAQNANTLKIFFEELTTAIWTYSKSITDISEDEDTYRQLLQNYFNIKKKLRKLGNGAEGVVFTDDNYVYKYFFNILDHEWTFLKEKSSCFSGNQLLEQIECFEDDKCRFICYPYHLFNPLLKVEPLTIASFLKFCKSSGFVFTNIKPTNFIQTNTGALKLIDYGKSFEPFTDDKFINSLKRAYLLIKFPSMKSDDFQKLTSRINLGEEPQEIFGWESLVKLIDPRKKEEILDNEVISIIKRVHPKRILDYGSGKCKTAHQLNLVTDAEVYVYDINIEVLNARCNDLKHYNPDDISFTNFFDLILINLVLCEVTNDVIIEILKNVSIALKPYGKVIVSICNPDFVHISRTEFQNRLTFPKSTLSEEVITKTCLYTGNLKTEYHRPTNTYANLFIQNGFDVIQIVDTDGINMNNLEYASDFKIFVLKK